MGRHFNLILSVGTLLLLSVSFQNCQPFRPVISKSSSSSSSASFLTAEQLEGKAIYDQTCKQCHGDLQDSVLRDRTSPEISLAILKVPKLGGLAYLSRNQKDLDALESYLGAALMCPAEPRSWQAARLTNTQVYYSLFDILGVRIDRQLLPIDGVRGSFQNNVELNFDLSALQSYLDFVEKSQSILMPAFKSRYANCQETNTTCLKNGFKALAEVAFRTPLSTTEADALYAVYTDSKTLGATHDEALSDILTYVFVSPRFLYPFESSRPAGVMPSGREIANRLALLVWFSIPDSALLAHAADGSLRTDAGLRSEVDRMLKDAKGERFHRNVLGGWVGLRSYLDRTPATGSMDESFQKETLLLFSDVLNSGLSPSAVFTANYTYANKTLGNHYGVSGNYASDSNNFIKVSTASTKRRGILSHGSFLSTVANATFATVYKRGNHVLRYVLCSNTPPPPGDVKPVEPGTQDPNLTEAELAKQHRNKADSCYACHGRMDPIGLSLSMFDQFGAEKSAFTPIAVDLTTLPDGSELGTPEALANYVTKGHRLQSCFVSGLNNYVYSGYQPADARCASETYREKADSKPVALKDWIVSVISDSVLNPK
jgi:hypothetical protein